MDIVINNLNYKNVLKNLNFNFSCNILITGTSSSGKTLFLNYLEQKYDVSRAYRINYFYHNSVEDEVRYLVLNEVQKAFIKKFASDLYIKENPNSISKKNKIKLSIIKGVVKAKNYVSFDNILGYLNKEELDILFNYLNKNRIKYIIVSNSLEEFIYTDMMYIMNDGTFIAYGPTNKMILEEKLLKRLGVKIPFIIDLSYRLKDYNLIQDIYLTKESLVDRIWK